MAEVELIKGYWMMYGGVPLILTKSEGERFIENGLAKMKNEETNELEFIAPIK